VPGMHERFAQTLGVAYDRIRAIQAEARADGWSMAERPRWPLIVLRTPKGWTGPREVDGVPVEGTWRSHQVPLADVRANPDHLAQLERWLRSYQQRSRPTLECRLATAACRATHAGFGSRPR